MKYLLTMSFFVTVFAFTAFGKCDPVKTGSTSREFTYSSQNGDSAIAQLRLMRIDADITNLYRELSHINARIDSLIQAWGKRGKNGR
jgi:hypothetical protein